LAALRELTAGGTEPSENAAADGPAPDAVLPEPAASEPGAEAPDGSLPAPDLELPGTSDWRPAGNPAALFFEDRDIARSCEGVTDALVSARAGLVLLAVPISPGEPFPMMPVFCFGTPWKIGGRDYIVFRIKDGCLTL
jgi:hypothetical protein